MHNKHGFDVQLLIHDDVCFLAEEISVFLFQAVKELLFNVSKHARVSSARVEVSRLDGQMHVTVDDHGAGFDQSQIRSEGGTAGGFGLLRINERLPMLGGRMIVESSLEVEAK